MDAFSYLAIIFTCLLYISVLFSVGTVFYSVLFETKQAKLYFNAKKTIVFFALFALLSSVANFFIPAINLTGEWSSLVDPEILGVLWQAAVGEVLAWRLVGLSILLAGLFIGFVGQYLTVLGSFILLWTFGQIGHVTTITEAHLTPAVLLLIHLLGLSLWLGVLLPLYRLAASASAIKTAAEIALHFGRLALVFVPVLIVAGGWLAFLLVGSLEQLFYTAYGQFILLKLFLVVGLLALAAANKYRYVPRINSGELPALKHLRLTIVFESLAVLMILLISSILTSVLSLP